MKTTHGGIAGLFPHLCEHKVQIISDGTPARIGRGGMASFVNAPLRGQGIHVGSVQAVIDMEIMAVDNIDSHYAKSGFDLIGVIADNASAPGFVPGAREEETRARAPILTGGTDTTVTLDRGDAVNMRFQDLGSVGMPCV